MNDSPAGWNTDPYGRHEQRYFDGSGWTEHVSDQGVQGVDPPGGAPAPPLPPRPPYQAPMVQQQIAPKKARWPWVLLGVFVFMVLGFVGCVALVSVGVNEVADSITEAQEKHAISQTQFDSIQIGTPKAEVLAALSKEPTDTTTFQSEAGDVQIQSDCIYYWESGETFGNWYQFCFDEAGNLRTKSAT
jgi:hypothetical protein